MARNTAEIRDYSEGYLFRAPLGTTLPTTIDACLALVSTPGSWTEMGHVIPPKMTPTRETNDIKGWANRASLGTIQTGVSGEFSVALLQTNTTTAALWQGSATGFTSTAPDHYAWVILALDGADHALAWTITDGQPGTPTEIDFGGDEGLQWGVTIKCFEDSDGMFWHGPYIDDDVVS